MGRALFMLIVRIHNKKPKSGPHMFKRDASCLFILRILPCGTRELSGKRSVNDGVDGKLLG